MRLIGDVHGKYDRYKRILDASPKGTIQVGDMGVGFTSVIRLDREGFGKPLPNPPHAKMVAMEARFIRGNHDNPGECAKHSQWIKDGTVEGDVMFIGGASSVDVHLRTEGLNWWRDEELSSSALLSLIEEYCEVKPCVMVTHDCPEGVAEEMERFTGRGKLNLKSRTRSAFDHMLSAHSPELWVFGHWHHHYDQVIRGTRFVCLAELQWMDF